jgi:hypothetical protein
MTIFGMTPFEFTEFLSYVVTVVGFPGALIVFIFENRKERQNEEEELNQRLSDQYTDFLKLVLENGDLQLLRRERSENFTDEQKERKFALFGILVALLEQAYIMVHEERMSKHTRRLWSSWDDYMREWCRRPDFRSVLPTLLEGEDEDFSRYIVKIAAEEAARSGR